MTKKNLKLFPNFNPSRKEILSASLLILFVILIQFFNTFKHFNTHFIGGAERDAGLYIWLSKISFKSLLNNDWFNTNAFYPYTKSLAWSDNYIFPSFLTFIFTKLSLSLPATYNLIILSAKFFQGFFIYKLAYLLRGNNLSAIISTVLFISLSYVTSQLGHPQMQWLVFIPASFYYYFKFLGSNSKLSGILLGITIFLSFLTSVYISFYIIYFLIFLSALLLFLKPSKLLLNKFLILSVLSFPALLLLIPFILPYLDVQSTFGSKHLYEAKAFSLNILDYLKANSYNFLYGKILSTNNQEKAVFSGVFLLLSLALIYKFISKAYNLKIYLNISLISLIAIFIFETLKISEIYESLLVWLIFIMLIVVLFRAKKNDRFLNYNYFTNDNLVLCFLFLSFIAFCFTLGPLAHVDDSIFPLSPYSIAYHLLPGFKALRASSRFVVILYFFLSLNICFLLPSLFKKYNTKILLSIFIPFIVFENYNFKYPLEELKDKPSVFNSIKLSADDAILVLPFTLKGEKRNAPNSFGDYALHNVNYMNWFSSTNYNLVNGYSGQRSRIINTYPFRLKSFPDSESLKAISEVANLNTILVLKSFINDEKLFLDQLKRYSKEIKIIKYENGNFLLNVNPIIKIENKNDYKLRIKSYPKTGKLKIRLLNINNSDKLNIFIEPYQLNTPVFSFNLQKNLEQEISFKVPNTIDKVRPRLLRFEPENQKEIIIKDIKFFTERN